MKHVEELLALWREAERVLEELPLTDPDRVRLVEIATQLRAAYTLLTDGTDLSASRIASTQATMDKAHVLLDAAQGRITERRGHPS
jgi:hypothetical protein